MRLPTPLRMAALISGGGRTVLNLLDWIDAGRLPGSMQLVLANKDCAGVERIRERGVPVDVLRASDFGGTAARDAELFDRLRAAQVDVVLLAGYLARIEIPSDFEHRVINIHPSLIPAFCGQGMFGDNVHAAVIQRGCKVTGCTVHFCDNEYDHGPIIAQRVVPVLDDDDPHTLAARVFTAECDAFPEALLQLMQHEFEIDGSRVTLSVER